VTDTIAFYHNPQSPAALGRLESLQADPAQHILLD
jgi:hypothetical protein